MPHKNVINQSTMPFWESHACLFSVACVFFFSRFPCPHDDEFCQVCRTARLSPQAEAEGRVRTRVVGGHLVLQEGQGGDARAAVGAAKGKLGLSPLLQQTLELRSTQLGMEHN